LAFATDTTPCGLLLAYKSSRQVILKVYNVSIQSQGFNRFKYMERKIWLDGRNDTVYLWAGRETGPSAIRRGRIFADIQWTDYLAEALCGVETLAISARRLMVSRLTVEH
jgi:hypothetical protein